MKTRPNQTLLRNAGISACFPSDVRSPAFLTCSVRRKHMRIPSLLFLVFSLSGCAPQRVSGEFIGPTSEYITIDDKRICSVQYRAEDGRLLYVIVAVAAPDAPLDGTDVLRIAPDGVFFRGLPGGEARIDRSGTVYLWTAGVGRSLGRIRDHVAVLKVLREGRPVASTVERKIGSYLEKEE